MNTYQRIAGTAACLAAALSVAACSSSGSKGTGTGSLSADVKSPAAAAPAGPLSGKSPTEIVALLKADMTALTSVHSVAHIKDGADAVSWDFHEEPGRGCRGTLSMGTGKGTMSMVVIGQKAWVKMDATAMKTSGMSGAGADMIRDKYIASSATSGQFSSMTDMCDMTKTLAKTMTDAAGLTVGSPTTVNGVQALALKAGDGTSIMITDTAHPYLITITGPASATGTMVFDQFNQPFTLTPPPASQVAKIPGM